jgi:hypothetical protein
MNNTKIILALVAVAALALVVIGLVSAQVAATQNIPGATPSTTAPNNAGFFGWIGRCFGYGAAPYFGAQGQVAPIIPTNPTTQNPYVNVPPAQGYYGYGQGCRGRFIP